MQRRTATSVSSSVTQATSLSPVWTTTLPVDNRLISSGHTESSTPLQSFPGALVGTELPLKTLHIIGPSWGDFISKLQIKSSTTTKNNLRYSHYFPVKKMGLTPKYAQATKQSDWWTYTKITPPTQTAADLPIRRQCYIRDLSIPYFQRNFSWTRSFLYLLLTPRLRVAAAWTRQQTV